jgi:hypothetical protein
MSQAFISARHNVPTPKTFDFTDPFGFRTLKFIFQPLHRPFSQIAGRAEAAGVSQRHIDA